MKAGVFLISVAEAQDVAELAVAVDADVYARDALALRHAGEELVRHLGQERARQYVVDVSRARLYFLAAVGYLVDDGVVVAEGRAVVLRESLAHAFELEP